MSYTHSLYLWTIPGILVIRTERNCGKISGSLKKNQYCGQVRRDTGGGKYPGLIMVSKPWLFCTTVKPYCFNPFNRLSICRRPDSHTRVSFFFPFAYLEMSLFPSIFCNIAVFSLHGEYVVHSFLPNGVFFLSVTTGWIFDISLSIN